MRRGLIAAIVLLSMCLSAPTTTAHDPTTFTVIVGENGTVPSNITGQVLFTNDSIWFRNVDNSENITHHLTIDMDGDGLYNGTEDISSGNLSSSCALDDNGTKLDSTLTNSLVALPLARLDPRAMLLKPLTELVSCCLP